MKIKAQSSLASTVRSPSVMQTLFFTAALMFGFNPGVQAQFTAAPGDEPSYTIGVFQLNVDPAFAFLFAPNGSIYYYPGYSPSSGVLTSPMMYDFTDTYIGVSSNHVRSSTPTYFPATVGTSAVYPTDFPDSVAGDGTIPVIPSGFSFPAEPYGKDEIMTEIENFNLQTSINSSTGLQCTNTPDSRVPAVATNVSVVMAGTSILPFLPANRRSYGMVQQTNVSGQDFPAQSFFNIYVDVDLPISAGNNSAFDFPPFSGNTPPTGQVGAMLYNDPSDPLVIVNSNLASLPPTAVYIHGLTTAVPMRFKYSNPPYWAADDVIGYLTLAGHGTGTSNDCASIAIAENNLLDTVLGPAGAPADQMATPWLRADDSVPSTNSSYGSVVNTVTNSSGTMNLDDTVSFSVPGLGTCYVRDLVLTGLSNSISPPVTSATYTANNTSLSFQFSSNGVSFTQETPVPTGTFQLGITNAGSVGSTTNFNLGILQLSNSATSFFGTVYLRSSPTLQSLGTHTIAPDPRGYRVSSVINDNLELSINGTTWSAANKHMRLQAGMPPAAPGSMFISTTNNKVILNWQNSFTLQSASVVNGPYADVTGPVTNGPYTNAIGTTATFYRLRQ